MSSDSDEFHELVNLVTINETYFSGSLFILRYLKRLIPNLRSTKNGEKVRILSAGCSTEKSYSIAMSIMEHHERWRFSVVIGIDIDGNALNKADSGFSADIF